MATVCFSQTLERCRNVISTPTATPTFIPSPVTTQIASNQQPIIVYLTIPSPQQQTSSDGNIPITIAILSLVIAVVGIIIQAALQNRANRIQILALEKKATATQNEDT